MKATRYSPALSLLFVFLILLFVSWFRFGLAFGGRGLMYPDEWSVLATSTLRQYPACTGIINWINPWRPFHMTAPCVMVQWFGYNSWLLNAMTFITYALTAFMWFGVVRNVFKLSNWVALVVAIVMLVYPDDKAWLSWVGGYRLLGITLTLAAIWLVLVYWDRSRAIWAYFAALFIMTLALLSYEVWIAVWAVALPLVLLVKSGKWSLRWFAVSTGIELVTLVNLIWRFYLVELTYNEKTAIMGLHAIVITPANFIWQLISSYALVGRAWERSFSWAVSWSKFVPDIQATARIFALSALAAALIALLLWLFYRYEGNRTVVLGRRGGRMFAASFLLVPLLAAPYMIVQLNLYHDAFRSYGTAFAGSLFVAALLGTARHRVVLVRTLTIFVVGAMFFGTVVTGYRAALYQHQTGMTCDFILRLTDVVEAVPDGVYLSIVSQSEAIHTADDDLYFVDPLMPSAMFAGLYGQPPFSPDTYSLGTQGHSGYAMFVVREARVTDTVIELMFPDKLRYEVHARKPLPDDGIPLDEALVVAYEPFESLSILSAPDRDDVVVLPEGGAQHRGRDMAEGLCNWFEPNTQTSLPA